VERDQQLGEVLTVNTPDGLDQQIRVHWPALQ
jgi:hypothetical protein